MTKYTDEQAAKAIVAVLPDSRWVGAVLARHISGPSMAVEGPMTLRGISMT